MSAPCPIFGFIVTIAPRDDGSATERAALVRDLADTLEPHGLAVERGTGGVIELVVHREGAQATDADRDLVRPWAVRWADRATIVIGDLIDLA
jgi:hypothetical protein